MGLLVRLVIAATMVLIQNRSQEFSTCQIPYEKSENTNR